MFGQPRSTFGATTTTFGTGFGTPSTTATTTGFGGSTFGRFGTPQQQTTSFGTGGAAPFGAATSSSTSLFGTQPQQSGGGLFGQPQTQTTTGFTSGFGTTSGGGLFGQTQQPATGLFGSGTGTGFGAQQSTQNRPFGFGQTTTSTTTTGGLFGTTPSTGGGLFGTSTGFGATGGAAVSGTTVKYEPVTGSDTMTRNGVSTNIRTRIEVITAMKEYESKSMEELRVEDYLANRKGPGQGGAMGGFGQTQQQQTPSSGGGLFSSTTGTSLFGAKAPENKSLFGTTSSTGFGTSSGGSLFGSSTVTPAFGQPSSTASTGFSFGQTQQQQPQQAKTTGFNFGSTATTTPSLFGTTTQQPQQPSFSMPGFPLGQNTQQQNTGGLFGTQNKPGTSGFLSTPNTGGGLFSNKPAGITQPLGTGFGTTSAVTPFGTTNTSTGVGTGGGGLFGNQNQNKGTTGLFSPFNTGTNMGTFGNPGLFGQNNNQQKPGGTLPFSSFGTSNLSTGFGSNPGGGFLNTSLPTSNTMGLGGTGTNTGFGMAQPNLLGGGGGGSVFPDLGKLVKAMTEKPILDLAVDAKANAAKGSPSGGDQVGSKLSNSNLKPTYVLSPSLVTSTKPKPKPINKNNNQNNNRHWLFKGLEDPNEETAEEFLKPKKYPSVRTLNLKVFRGTKTDTNPPSTPIEGRGRVNGEVEGKVSQVGEGADSPSPLTTPLTTITDSTPLPLVTKGLVGRTHDNSPTPDIIKGRPIKHLNIPDKPLTGQQFDDTLADLNVRAHQQDSEADKENDNSGSNTANISLFNVSNATEDEEEEVANLSSLVTEEIIHPAGIKLQRPGYYTLPPMDELAQMVVTEPNDSTPTPNKRCPVENFTVGRYGYGNVCFLGVTDVAGLDLDATVFIVRKQVEVYPPGTIKPPRGRKLNRPAIVTLDCVWPVDKTTREVIKSEDRLQAMGWTEYLERQCVKMEASFLEYRPETGSWVFKVHCF